MVKMKTMSEGNNSEIIILNKDNNQSISTTEKRSYLKYDYSDEFFKYNDQNIPPEYKNEVIMPISFIDDLDTTLITELTTGVPILKVLPVEKWKKERIKLKKNNREILYGNKLCHENGNIVTRDLLRRTRYPN